MGRRADVREALGPHRHPMPPASSDLATADPRAQKLLTQMTRLDGDLGEIEKQILALARAPLSRTTPLEDLEGRIRSHKVGERGIRSGSTLGGHELKTRQVWEQPQGPNVSKGNAQSKAHTSLFPSPLLC